jgi:hypothetical protein
MSSAKMMNTMDGLSATQPNFEEEFGDDLDAEDEVVSPVTKKHKGKGKSKNKKSESAQSSSTPTKSKKREREDLLPASDDLVKSPKRSKSSAPADAALVEAQVVATAQTSAQLSTGQFIGQGDRSQWDEEAKHFFEAYEESVMDIAKAREEKGETMFVPADEKKLSSLTTENLQYLAKKQSSEGRMAWDDLLKIMMQQNSDMRIKYKAITNKKTNKTSVKFTIDGRPATYIAPPARVSFARKRSEKTRIDKKDPSANQQAWIFDMFPFTHEDNDRFGYNSDFFLFAKVFIPLLDRRLARYLCHNQPEIYENDYKKCISKPDKLFALVSAAGGSMRTGVFCDTDESGEEKPNHMLFMVASKLAFDAKEDKDMGGFEPIDPKLAKVAMAIDEYTYNPAQPLMLATIPHISAATGKWANVERCYNVRDSLSPLQPGHIGSVHVNPIPTEAKGKAGAKNVPNALMYFPKIRVDHYSPGLVETLVDTGDLGKQMLKGEEDEFGQAPVYEMISLSGEDNEASGVGDDEDLD